MSPAIPVYVETGTRRVFACAVDWVGWCRAAKTEEDALEALASYADRYRPVSDGAGQRLPKRLEFEVVERIAGDATTDFGAPGRVPDIDRTTAITPKAADRLASLVEAAWAVLDEVVATSPPTLRKGPRGGGRDRDAVFDHVVDAEASYGRQVGVRLKQPTLDEQRAAIAAAIRDRQEGKWPTRYAARRIAWHVLDHAWEIEDRRESDQPTSPPKAR